MKVSDETRAALRAAYDVIPIKSEQISRIGQYVEALVYFREHTPDVEVVAPNWSLPSTTKQAEDELAAVRNASRALHAALGAMHRPAIDALRAHQFNKLDGVCAVPTTYLEMHGELSAYTYQLKDIASKAKPEGTKQAARPINAKCLGLARTLAQQYRELTRTPLNGTETKLPSEYIGFVGRVFSAFGYQETSRFFAERVIQELKVSP